MRKYRRRLLTVAVDDVGGRNRHRKRLCRLAQVTFEKGRKGKRARIIVLAVESVGSPAYI